MQSPFIEPEETNNSQLLFLTLIYAYVLYQASGLISGGSELLMLVPAVAGIVGSIVLPILGAVPDGMMVLFSGVGEKAQETVAVGVGALAGSTVMLLTFPWFICIMFGRVPITNGKADYSDKGPMKFTSSGITFGPSIKKNAMIMLATTALYLVIQLPATMLERMGATTQQQAAGEHGYAYIGLICCIVAFAGYLVYCFMDANEDKQLARIIAGIENKQVSIGAALQFIQKTSGSQRELLDDRDKARLKKVCKPFFKRYDFDHDKSLNVGELKPLMHELGFWPSSQKMKSMMEEGVSMTGTMLQRTMDKDGDGNVSFDEFVEYLYAFMLDSNKMAKAPDYANTKYVKYDEDDEDEEEEMPEDLAHLSHKQQMVRVVLRSLWMMGLGTLLVLAFSDPMVDCLSEWGKRLDISPFYISFILAPFASNASELLSAYTYAVKKTEKNMTTSLSTLIGAACMNNTFVLAIFLALIYVQGLAWQFTAETVAMVVVQWVIGLLALTSRTQSTITGIMILLCYPGCLFLVWFMQNELGWD